MKATLVRPSDLIAATALLTRLPLPTVRTPRGAAASWAWPMAGVPVGAAGALAAYCVIALGMPPSAAAGAVIAAQILVTGALHEDGLADTADGLWGGWTRERRLEIMRDSRIGAYGVLALVIFTGLRWALIAEAIATGSFAAVILAAAMGSRATMLPIARLPHARDDGLSRGVGRPEGRVMVLGLLIGALPAFVLGGAAPLVAGAVAIAVVAYISRSKIGGQTGDILGATQQIAEIALLGALI